MKIALLGYGRMGKAIEAIALERGHQIVYKQDFDLQEGTLQAAQVAINFSIPDAAVQNIKTAMDAKVPVVCGTTGWLAHYESITAYCHKQQSGFLYASNFSIGVNLFFKLNKALAQWMAPHSSYQARLEETHHIHKLDAPSGTAITLAEGILETGRYKQWALDSDQDSDLSIHAVRTGEVPGTHTVHYTSAVDEIQIKHEAFSRTGFALGAVVAAEWLAGKQGVYSMEDVINVS